MSLSLLGGRGCKPPISYMGSKRGYATTILTILGLHPGQGADRVLLVDAGPWGLVWQGLADRETGMAIADRIASWQHDEPRELWDRLKAEASPLGDARPEAAEAATAWLRDTPPAVGAVQPDALASHLLRAGWAYERGNVRTGFAGPGMGGRPADLIAAEVGRVTTTISAWLGASALGFNGKPMEAGFGGKANMGEVAASSGRASDAVAGRIFAAQADVRLVRPPDDCSGVVMYIDPPYQGTTSYKADLPRADVMAVAAQWAAAGALVCISEAEPVPLPGWAHVQIDHGRRGTKRTFSVQQDEWLTISRPPAVAAPPQQAALF